MNRKALAALSLSILLLGTAGCRSFDPNGRTFAIRDTLPKGAPKGYAEFYFSDDSDFGKLNKYAVAELSVRRLTDRVSVLSPAFVLAFGGYKQRSSYLRVAAPPGEEAFVIGSTGTLETTAVGWTADVLGTDPQITVSVGDPQGARLLVNGVPAMHQHAITMKVPIHEGKTTPVEIRAVSIGREYSQGNYHTWQGPKIDGRLTTWVYYVKAIHDPIGVTNVFSGDLRK